MEELNLGPPHTYSSCRRGGRGFKTQEPSDFKSNALAIRSHSFQISIAHICTEIHAVSMMSGCLISKLKNTPFRAGTSSKWNFSSQISDVLLKTSSGNIEAWKVRSLFTQSQAISISTLCKVVVTVLWRHPLWLNLYMQLLCTCTVKLYKNWALTYFKNELIVLSGYSYNRTFEVCC